MPDPTRPTVSVVLPTFNRLPLLRESVASVLGQTFQDFELVVVDDGSMDGTDAWLDGQADPRLRVVSQANAGKSAARNAGIAAARGQYLSFLDSDDLWKGEFLEVTVGLLTRYPELDFVFTDLERFGVDDEYLPTQFDLSGDFPRRLLHSPLDGGARLEGDPFSLLVPSMAFVTWLQCSVLNRERLGSIRFPDPMPLGQDYAYMLKVYRVAERCAFIDRPLARIRRHTGNSYQSTDSHLLPTIQALKLVYSEDLSRRQRQAVRRRLGAQWSTVGYHAFWSGQLGNAARGYWNALRWPGNRLRAILHLLALPTVPFLRNRTRGGQGMP